MRTHISVVLDASGSMLPQQLSVINNINKFLDEQRSVEDPCTISITTFNTGFKTLYRMQDIRKIEGLNVWTYRPDGFTALRQALIQEIDATGVDLVTIPPAYRPEKVIFVTVTDGEENASGWGFGVPELRQRVALQTETYKWEFIYLGANIDSFASGAELGFNAAFTSNYVATAKGLNVMYSTVSRSISEARTGVRSTSAFTAAEQDVMATADEDVQLTGDFFSWANTTLTGCDHANWNVHRQGHL